MEKHTFQGVYRDNKRKYKALLPLISFKDGEAIIIYSPALDISGYGSTEQEAKQSFGEAIEEFFKYTLNKGTFEEELKRLGWKCVKRNEKYNPPKFNESLANNDRLNEIINNREFNKYNENVEVPVCG